MLPSSQIAGSPYQWNLHFEGLGIHSGSDECCTPRLRFRIRALNTPGEGYRRASETWKDVMETRMVKFDPGAAPIAEPEQFKREKLGDKNADVIHREARRKHKRQDPFQRQEHEIRLYPDSLDKNRNHSTSRQLKLAMPNRIQQTRNTPRMAGERYERVVIVLKHIRQQLPHAHNMLGMRFSPVGPPELVLFAEIVLDGVGGKFRVDVGTVASAVAGVFAVCFAQELGRG